MCKTQSVKVTLVKGTYLNLDYSIKTLAGRKEHVNKLLAAGHHTNNYLTYMADYLLFVADKNQTKKEHKKAHPIVTKNREVTVSKRQISLEGVAAQLEDGEDGLYALIMDDKNQLLDRKQEISQKDIDEVPGLKACLDTITSLKNQFQNAKGQERYAIKRQIIETWQQIYILRSSFRPAPARGRTSNQIKSIARMELDESVTLDSEGYPQSDCIVSLFNPAHISFLLCYYSQLKQEVSEDLNSDIHYLLLDLENLVDEVITEDHPMLYDLLIWKIDGKTNKEIQSLMEAAYGVKHNEQYWSTLWRKRIPHLLSRKAQENYLNWYYTNIAYGKWKECGKCGQVKLAHPLFFSKNSSQDGYYSVCKCCRSGKYKEKKNNK